MLNLASVTIGTSKPKELAQFYAKVFDKAADLVEENSFGWHVGNTFLMIGLHPDMTKPSTEAGRVVFNLETKAVDEEFARLKSLGVTVVKEPYELGVGWMATFADPDGNYFQLMTPWEKPSQVLSAE